MTTAALLANRKKWQRPHGLIFTDSYSFDGNIYVPYGTELIDYIVLSDHGRDDISINFDRIETRSRMLNGRMRSVWVADKMKIKVSWKALPSRSTASGYTLDNNGNPVVAKVNEFTADIGAGAIDLANWYNNHSGSFWVLMSFDKKNSNYALLKYTYAVECFFENFDYSVSKRGPKHDLWDVSLSLEEA